MIRKLWFAVMTLVIMLNCEKNTAQIKVPFPISNPGFKTIGYLLESDIAAGNAVNFEFGSVTHLNIAFINSDQNGNFPVLNGLSAFITLAHQKKCYGLSCCLLKIC